jgi:hypothetical protein
VVEPLVGKKVGGNVWLNTFHFSKIAIGATRFKIFLIVV